MIRTLGLTALSTGLSLALASPALAQEAPPAAPMTAQDLVTMPRVGISTTSPDGENVIYTVTKTDPETYERSTAMYLQDITDLERQPVEIDLGPGASDAAFGSDGRVYFLSSATSDETSQVWRATLSPTGAASEVKQVTKLGADVHGFHLSPDASKIAVFGNVARECTTFSCDEGGNSSLTGPGTGMLFEGDVGFVRHWDVYETPGEYGRVFAYDISDGAAQSGVALDGPAGEGALIASTPTRPFGGPEDIAWGADSDSIYFAARVADRNEPYSTNVDIYQSDLSGGAPVNVTEANKATDILPAPSPDGKYLAYAAMERAGYEADKLTVMLRDLGTGQVRALTKDWDRSVGSLTWTPDSEHIIATAQEVLDTPAFRIDVKSGKVTRLTLAPGREGRIGSISAVAGDRLVFTRSTIEVPSDVYVSQYEAPGRRISYRDTDEVLSRLTSVTTQRFSFEGAGGDTVWGQITKPIGHDGQIPAILYVHGGPQGSFNDGWSSRWNPRVVASQGYAVISVDFHGSTGYGQEFTDSINQDWGGKPLEDLQKGLAAALKLDSSIDGDRACAMGASYGGYMMNWIAGKWPDRFDCLIQHDGLFDMRSFYYTTEELWFPKWDFDGSYAENPELYEKWNPVNHVANWKTPMLVITGEKDYRVPYTQGIASFTALQEKQIPSQLLVFPDENHWVLKPKNSLQWHNTVFDWLERWTAE
ncbi:S9 family peptidase [Altererythrobacter sp. ZODW24]|uniref:alpha/beta hydrolase family protein n=1 Tax=Altererythrobacter sp. ZODW24 TaxID=2185142 RepID=UPI000DF80E02|nr:S9 family peptidase [Altererythrobacter sp. ZODW24]